jgi:hypothetical protein
VNKILGLLNRPILKYKKIIYSNSTNSPYISGDTFLELCDINIKNMGSRNLNSIKKANTIFCESHCFEEFLEEYGSVVTAKIMFVGNSDKEFHDIKFRWPRSVKKMFIQNSYISDSKRIFTLPIGLENKALGSNGIGKYRNIPYEFTDNRVLLGPFGNTHLVRQLVNREFYAFSEMSEIYYLRKRLRRRAYRKLLRNYNLIACPRGNGVDTHRLWESIYYGRYPVIAEDVWAKSLDYLKIPKIEISSWSAAEIKKLTTINYELFNPNKIQSIWEPYWVKIIKES